ncbi:MAG: exonuclease domain-containing protein [Flavobacteriaceae bacterium]
MYAVLDIETTGGKYNEEGITEIAIHKFDGHQVIDRFVSLVNPEKDIQPFVVNLTGINNKMLRTAPKFHEVAKRIVEITEGTVIVAHNAQFDYRVLRMEFRKLGYTFERKTLCTVDLSKRLIPQAESHSLGKLVRSLGIAVSDRHRANGDALATLKLFKFLLTKDSNKSIIRAVIKAESLGELSQRQIDIVTEMPSETGVYYMYNKEGELIFLGKSTDIKRKVNHLFTRDGKEARKLQKATRKVTYELTGSELIALLKENEELQRNRPLYNQWQGRPNLKVRQSENGQGPDISINIQENYLIVGKGRETGEKSAVWIRNGRLEGVGFFDLNHQINNIHILESIITPMHDDKNAKEIIDAYLKTKKGYKIIELNPEH